MDWPMTEHIETVRVALDIGMVVLIWLVQLIIYPSFKAIEPERFTAWHHTYVQRISYVVLPLMIGQAACIGLQLFSQRSPGNILSALFVLMAWLVTFTLSVPCHNRLQKEGNASKWIDRLISTNWLRTIAWSAVFICDRIPG